MRFTIRSTFITTLVIACGLAVLLYATQNYHQRRAIAAVLREAGAAYARVNPSMQISVVYSNPLRDDQKLQRFDKFNSVEFQQVSLDKETLSILATLDETNNFLFRSCTFEDESDLALLRDANVLSILFWGTELSEEGLLYLAEMQSLRGVAFINTSAPPSFGDRLRELRPDLDIKVVTIPQQPPGPANSTRP